ncbi:HalOD1 output domain-containing protein [Halosegnis marinus]|uniref:HalOD1 output domain-containing protein n=1 Tax=Halosegnis marinus TaxID=3034023 RepID=UPI00360F8D6E
MDDSRNGSTPGPCPPTTDYRAYHDPDGTAKLSTAVTHALADAMEQDVTEAGFVLFDTIDPDALDRLFSPRTRPKPPRSATPRSSSTTTG